MGPHRGERERLQPAGRVVSQRLPPCPQQATRLAPWCAGLEGGLVAAAGRALAAAPFASLIKPGAHLRRARLHDACAAAPWLRRLECLTLSGLGDLVGGGSGTPAGTSGSAATPLTALTSLSLTYCFSASMPSEPPPFAALITAPWFGRLHSLDLSSCPLGTARSSDGAGLRALSAASEPWQCMPVGHRLVRCALKRAVADQP